LCYSPYIIRVIKSKKIRWVKHKACMNVMRNSYRILVKKPEGKRQPGGPKHTREGNIKMDLKATGCEDVEWMHLP